MHLRVNGETVEISLDEQPPNFPDALQIDICNAMVHLVKNTDIKPHTMLESCNPSYSVVLQLEELSPDTSYTVFADIPLRIDGTTLTCALTTSSAELFTGSSSSSCSSVIVLVVALLLAMLILVK